MIVLSLFGGMECGRIALDRAGIKVDKYYSSEIDKYAIEITQKNYPDTIQLGDITKWKEWDIDPPDMIIGGSPCQGFSMAGKQLNFDDPRSKLFFTFVEILNHYKPKYFLLENVRMKIDYERIINEYMKCYPIDINSALVSAQNRRRLYWTNIGQVGTDLFGTVISGIPQPEDKGIFLKDILNNEVDEKYYLSEKYLKYINNRKNNFNSGKINIRNDKKKASCINKSSYKTDISDNLIMISNYMRGFGEKDPRLHKDKSVTLRTPRGGGHLPLIVAQRGRENGQELEPNFTGKTNALTSVEKDNYVIDKPICIGIIPESIKEKGNYLPRERIFSINGKGRAVSTVENQRPFILQRGRGFNKGGKHYKKSPPITSNAWEQNNNLLIRRLTPVECERLQTVPDNYTAGVSDTQRYKMLGNGWTVDVIVHILKHIQEDK